MMEIIRVSKGTLYTIRKFNRRRDRIKNDLIFISHVELAEQGINDAFKMGPDILYNGFICPLIALSNDGISIQKLAVINEDDLINFDHSDGYPYFKCPCGTGHYVDPINYNYCTQGAGRVVYKIEDRKVLEWFIKHKKEKLLFQG